MHHVIRQLSKPSKVASVLDWKKAGGSTVLALNIHRDRVGIAVASHPSYEQPCIELEPLRFTKPSHTTSIGDEDPAVAGVANHRRAGRDNHITSIDERCLERFRNIIDEYNVCGVVVSWPLQHDSGKMGAACGRVVYALEQLWDKSNGGSNGVLSRPFCLWDSGHIVPKQRRDPKKHVDEFGRCADYSSTTAKDEYFASKERYYEDELTVVCQVWNDFCKEHWPELFFDSLSEPDQLREIKRQQQKHTQMKSLRKPTVTSGMRPTTNSGVAFGT